jgi:hypothetical protein
VKSAVSNMEKKKKKRKGLRAPVTKVVDLKDVERKPIWKEVKRTLPFCPQCGSELKRATGDVGTMFTWECSGIFCYFVC